MRHKPTVLEQAIQHFPWSHFDRLVRAHRADKPRQDFNSRQHFVALLAAALGGQQGLRPAVAGLAPNAGALTLLGGGAPARSTLAEANRNRPAALFVDLLHALIGHIHKRTDRRDLRTAVRLIDATHLPLNARMNRWFALHQGQVAAKLHVVYDPTAQQPVYFALTQACIHDIAAAKTLLPIEAGATYVYDLGYYDFAWWAKMDAAGCTFVTRLKDNTRLRAVEARPVEPDQPILAVHTGFLPERLSHSRRNPFQKKIRAIVVRIDTGKVLRLLTNDLTSPPEAIAALYKERWQIELFFRWIKQNLKITRFMGESENAVRVQIAVAFIAYLLVRVLHDQQPRPTAAVTILLIIRTHLFVRRPLLDLLHPGIAPPVPKPMPLFSDTECK